MLEASSVVLLGGIGKKIVAVLLGEGEFFFYSRGGSSKWDICAGEVLI
jgi:fructose-1,6-bisphosphatase/inositol monophosphatase family enzyme